MIEAVILAVHDRAVGEQRREASPDRVEQILLTANVEKAFLLAREARVGQILGGGAASHRDIQIFLDARILKACDTLYGSPRAIAGGNFARVDHLAYRLRSCRESDGFRFLISASLRRNRRPRRSIGVDETPSRHRRHREALGDRNALLAHLPGHLTERGIFASQLRNLGGTLVGEPDDIVVVHFTAPCAPAALDGEDGSRHAPTSSVAPGRITSLPLASDPRSALRGDRRATKEWAVRGQVANANRIEPLTKNVSVDSQQVANRFESEQTSRAWCIKPALDFCEL